MRLNKISVYCLLFFTWFLPGSVLGTDLPGSSSSMNFAGTTSPVLSNPEAFSVHYGNEQGFSAYNVGLSVTVSDPQGLTDIAKVSVSGPGGFSAVLLDPENDGSYFAWISSGDVPPQTGTYVFRATDKEGNWIETTDIITRNLGFPLNLRPQNNEFVTTPSPSISWDAVPNATSYQLTINDINGNRIWTLESLTTTSVIYNFDLSASSGLRDGSAYYLNVSALDPEGNRGELNCRFVYSTNSSLPVLSEPVIQSRNWLQPNLSQNWGINAQMHVADPQGLSDVDSVWVEGPHNYHLRLYDDGNHWDNKANDGTYGHGIGGFTVKPLIGVYTFKVRDKSSNLAIKQDQLTAVLDCPRNFTPEDNTIISDPNFTMSWDRVEGAVNYEVNINSTDWSTRYWTSQRLIQTTVQYNVDQTGTSLTDGGVYRAFVRAWDNDGNESEVFGWKIAYRINDRATVYVDSSNVSGTENGTAGFPFNTLWEGINGTVKNDTVRVARGTYDGKYEDIGSINLMGEDPEKTIIKGSCIFIGSTGARVNGFKITGSNYAAIEIHGNAVAEISNNIITGNPGGGIFHGWGNASSSVILNNTIVGNGGPAVSIETGSTAVVTNNIIAYNQTGISNGPGTTLANTYNAYFSNSTDLVNVQAGTGEIFSNPRFTNYTAGVYSLLTTSPCIDKGNPDPDSDGIPWEDDPDDRDPDNTRSDMGALHLDQRKLTPDIPAALSAKSCNNLVTLHWKKNTGLYFDHYSILGGTSMNPTEEIAIINNISDTIKILTALTPGLTYYFRLQAVNRSGVRSDFGSMVNEKVKTGVIPKIKTKWNDVLICYNLGDSISQYQWFRDGNPVAGETKQYYFTSAAGTYYVTSTDINGCKNSSGLLTLSGKAMSVYPNPAKVSFKIRLDEQTEGEAMVYISNSSGIRLMQFEGVIANNGYIKELPVSSLDNGIYFITVVMKDNKSYSGKIVVLK